MHSKWSNPTDRDVSELWYNIKKYVFTENIVKWDEKTRARCLVKKLGLVVS